MQLLHQLIILICLINVTLYFRNMWKTLPIAGNPISMYSMSESDITIRVNSLSDVTMIDEDDLDLTDFKKVVVVFINQEPESSLVENLKLCIEHLHTIFKVEELELKCDDPSYDITKRIHGHFMILTKGYMLNVSEIKSTLYVSR